MALNKFHNNEDSQSFNFPILELLNDQINGQRLYTTKNKRKIRG